LRPPPSRAQEILRKRIQPGAKLDYERPTEQVTVTFRASAPFELVFDKAQTQSHLASDGVFEAEVKHPGHFAWTFDDPLYRAVLLRGICWAAQRPPGDLSALSTVGARMAP
jgi:hypothetical protein